MKDEPPGYVALGRFGAPHGVKGWIRLISYTDPLDNILEYRHFKLRDGSRLTDVEIDASRVQGKGFVAHVKGCDDRDRTRQYTGRDLLVERAALPALESGDYYWYQLEGLEVLNLRDEALGTVDHLIETGANDVLVVRGGPDGRERLIPYAPGEVVREVDLEAGMLRVDWDKDY